MKKLLAFIAVGLGSYAMASCNTCEPCNTCETVKLTPVKLMKLVPACDTCKVEVDSCGC